jgi:low affinity Fe/Cu permease
MLYGDRSRHWLTHRGGADRSPAAFVVFGIRHLLGGFQPSLDWEAIATLATWGMTLVIQRAEHRDTQALHAKLDELLRIHGEADNTLMRVD